jgi:FkbM family methyltransferase
MTHLYSFPKIFSMSNCRYGQMIYPERDAYVGRSLAQYGEFSEGEAEFFKACIKPGDLVVEAGANIGAHTVLFARLVGQAGGVLAFEPQPVLFQALCANLALNNIDVARAEKCGLGERPHVLHLPIIDYEKNGNFGGVSLDRVKDGISVPVRQLDVFNLRRCDFIKIDVEGMERQVIEGAANTIYDHRPILFVENDRAAKSADLIQLLLAMKYSLWWHVAPLFNADNFAGNPVNLFEEGDVSINMLCFPNEKIDAAAKNLVKGLAPVEGPDCPIGFRL